jgi:hypothetical protein
MLQYGSLCMYELGLQTDIKGKQARRCIHNSTIMDHYYLFAASSINFIIAEKTRKYSTLYTVSGMKQLLLSLIAGTPRSIALQNKVLGPG